MTRLSPLVFALILGLLTAAVLFLGVYYKGTLETRLTWSLGMGALMFFIAWFNAMRVRDKSGKEQGKARWITTGLMALLVLGSYFADYKNHEKAFIAECSSSYNAALCKCIENRVGHRLYQMQLPYRPLVALGQMSEANLQAGIRRDGHEPLRAAASICAANPRAR